MLRGDSRQLLILGVPTITLVFGLLFLRHRRRKRGTLHTDPGGTTDNTPNQKEFSIENDDILPTVDNQLSDVDHFSKVDEKNVETAFEKTFASLAAEFSSCKQDLVEYSVEPVNEEVVQSKIEPLAVVQSEILISKEEDAQEHCSAQIIDLTETSSSEEECQIIEIVDLIDSTSEEVVEIVDEVVDLTENSSPLNTSGASSREEGELTSSTILEESVESQTFEEHSTLPGLSLDEVNSFPETTAPSEPNTQLETSLEEGELPNSSVEQVEEEILSTPQNVVQEPPATSLAETEKMKKNETGELVDKLVNLELDSMTISSNSAARKESAERDSANHSPSEVMLASPSISNFSDAHSEGSSDSGKGHSDVATSPSRTPAGGSSLAGDLALSLYEFVLPQSIVGRLIGRHGASLHEIRSSTGTNIFIKRHPETNKLKICAIEGTQQDIDKALAKIRQKFPLRRFPHLTLEKVSFVSLNSVPPLKLEDFHLQLVEGVNNDVILSSLISAAHFFLQQPSHPSYASLSALNAVMNSVYSAPEAPILSPSIKDAVCAAPAMGGWYRAQVLSVDEENGTSYVRFLDYGGYLVLQSTCLRQIRGDLLTLPFQAVECYLANVAPAVGEFWTDEARLFVQSLTQGQVLQAQIYDYAEDGTPLVYLYTSFDNEVILINEELVVRGFAVLTASPTASGEEEEE